MPQSNVVRLQQAGLLKPGTLSQDEKDLLETLTEQEVDALISVKDKLGYTGTLQEGMDDETEVGAIF